MVEIAMGWNYISHLNINFVNNVSHQSIIFLILFCIWIIFLTFYISRIIGPIIAYILTYIAHKCEIKCILKLGSLSISLLAGKIMFRDFTFICDDYAIYCNDGYLIFSYWRYIKLIDLYARDLNGRLCLTLNGLHIHIYNHLKAYRKLKKDAKFEKLFATISQQQYTKKRNDKFLKNFWTFVGAIHVCIKNFHVYVGNRLLPTTLVTFSHKTLVIGRLEQVNNIVLFVCSINGSNFSISLNNNNEYDENDPYNLWKRYNEPRTMGSGFKVLQNATLNAVYRASIFADPLSEQICDLNVDFGENVAIAYGPWAEACRVAFFNYFFPADFTYATSTMISTELSKNDEPKIPLIMDITLTMNGKTTINLWFMRHDELNTVAVIIKNGFSIRMKNPLVTAEEEYKMMTRFSMKDVQFLPSSGFRKLISCEDLTVDYNMRIPKQYGQIQKCEILLKMNRATIWCVLDHIFFIQDFINEISAYDIEDLARFVPQIWNCRIKLNNVKFIFVANDKNWVDASNPLNNFLIAIVAKRFTISCDLNKADFCPQIRRCKAEMIANENVAIKFHVPQRSTLSPIIHTLYDNSFYSSTYEPIAIDIEGSWVDFLRTQQIIFTYDCTWHPIYLPYQSDLPIRIKTTTVTRYPIHPFELKPNSVEIEIVIQLPELFLSGFALWIIKNFVDDYFGLYTQQSDMDTYQAHALLSRRFYGNLENKVEKYRPIDVKLSIRIQKAHGHCLTHAIKTTGENPDTCPTIKTNVVVVEVVRKIRDLRCQVFIAGLQVLFRKSESFKKVQDGLLSIDQIAIRVNSFSSELNIPWNAGVVEYACAWEIIIGEIIAKIDPTQLICFEQIIESFFLLSAAIDEELLIPEIYDICHHMNDVRTCPHSNLELIDLENRIQNCERSKNLKYILIRIGIDLINIIIMEDITMICILMESCRMCTCNCHELSFSTSFLFGILQLDFKQFIKYSRNKTNDNEWLECGSAHFQDIEFEIRLPFSSKNLYLINERKKFLMMHDEYTKRLYFLWLDENKCGCYGSFAFFGEDDWSGCIFMADFAQKLARPQINNELKQPGFGQSIICPSIKLFDENNPCNINISNEQKKSATRNYQDNFGTHSETIKSISVSRTLLDTYHNFLNAYHIQLKNTNTTNIVNRFELIRNGINNLHLINKKGMDNKSKENLISAKDELSQTIFKQEAQMILHIQRPSNWGADPEVVYGWGNISSITKIFITPLSIEVIQRLTKRAEIMLTTINPISIIQHAYALCAFQYHKQPIIGKNNIFIRDTLLPAINANFGLPPVYITLFQATIIDDQMLKNRKDKDNYTGHIAAHSTVTMIYGRECYLSVFSNKQNEMQVISFDAQTLYHAQFAKIVYLRENKPLIDDWQMNFSTNWKELDVQKRLRHSNLIILSELDVPDISLKGSINRQSIMHWFNDSEIIIRTGDPRLKISSGNEYCDKQSDVTLLQLAITSSIISWLDVLYQFHKSFYHTLAKYDEWFDLCTCKALSEALDLRDDLILSVCQSSLNEVKQYAIVMNGCASCKLMLFLLHCSMHKDEAKRYNYWKNHSLALDSFIASKSNRKFALIALLNSWQKLLEPHVKITDLSTAKKYSRSLLSKNMKSVKRKIPTIAKDDIATEQLVESSVSVSISDLMANPTIGSDITENLAIKQFDILLFVFFWPLFKNYHLDTNMVFRLPHKRLQFSFRFMTGKFKTFLIQSRIRKNQTAAQQSFLFLLLDTITANTTVTYDIITDNQQLTASKVFLTINFETLFPRIEIFCIQAVLHLLSEMSQSIGYCMIAADTVTSMDNLDDTQNSFTNLTESIIFNDNGARKQQKWILTMLYLFHHYKMNAHAIEGETLNTADFSITINSNTIVSAIKIESKIMHLIVMLRIFNSKISYNNMYIVDKPKKATQEIIFTIQNIKMMITEKGILDINAMFRGLLTAVVGTFRSSFVIKTKLKKVNNDSNDDDDDDDNDNDDGKNKKRNLFVSSPNKYQRIRKNYQSYHFNFDIKLLHGEMNAKISLSVTAKYNFKNMRCFGIFPIKGTVSIENHFITYTSFYSKKAPKWIRLGNFSIKLPSLMIVYEKRTINENEIIRIDNKEIVCSNESYVNIIITIGSLDQSINTDVLNMLLYSHERAIDEFAHVMEIVRSSMIFDQNSYHASSFLFQLQMHCENVSPWLKLTLTDTTNTAFRVTAEVVNMFLISRNILNDNIFEKQIWGNISFCLNFKLGQMIRNETFQEDELRELADFTTNLVCKLQFGPKRISNAAIIFSHTVILFKFPAIIRAKNILEDFKLSRNFWMKQKMHHMTQAESDFSQITSHSPLLDVTDNFVMKITLLFRDRTTACIPLYSNNYHPFTSALLFGLKDAEAMVKFVQGAKAETKFSDLKIVFVENFEHSMEDSWINGQEVTPTNFIFFPLGVCKIVVKSSKRKQYKQVVSVQCSMKGLVFDIDSRIGSLIGAVRNTCAAINDDQDVDSNEYEPMKIVISEIEQDDDINPKNEYASIVKPEERIRWVEQKIYEQTQKLAKIKTHTTDMAYEWELRRLKKLQLIRVKQFTESMLERLKRQKLRGKQLKKIKTDDGKEDVEEELDDESVTGEQSTDLFQNTASNQQLQEKIGDIWSLQQPEIPIKINDNAVKSDEKLNDELFIFDMQFFGEAGECVLRNRNTADLINRTGIITNDIKNHNETGAKFTKISLPSIEAKAYYFAGNMINYIKSFPVKKSISAIASNHTSMPYLYISANVANMPEETALTPLVADFFQQILETLPQHIPQQSENESDTFSMADTESLLFDSKLMINMLLSITIQSSSLRFEAHQQFDPIHIRAGAMDLLLRLPSLKLVATTHNDAINNGLDISLSLRSFSVCFYNPHQPSALDAFTLTLDKFTVGISRTSIFLRDRSLVKIACTIDIGQASIAYDMRKLSDLITFTDPWYRRKTMQRLLLKRYQSSKTQSTGAGRFLSKRRTKMMDKLTLEASISAHWEAFKAKIQMSSAMGETNWIIEKISAKITFYFQPFIERRLNVYFAVSLLEHEAKGGAISGSVRLFNVETDFSWISLCNKPTSFSSKINFSKLEMRIFWMDRVVIVALLDQPSILFNDEWKLDNDRDGKIKEATIMFNAIFKYSKLQAIITKTTFYNIGNIIQKLNVFFQEQIQESRTLLNLKNGMPLSLPKNEQKPSIMFHWATILDLVTDIQMKNEAFPMPNDNNGRTIISGRFISIGQQASLVLMEGEITANRWALFYLNQPILIFSNAAQYTFLDKKQTVGIDLFEKLLLKLSGVTEENKFRQANWTSVICKPTFYIMRHKNQTCSKDAQIQKCLMLCIDEPLAQLFLSMQDPTKRRSIVLELFELPAMDSIFTSNQKIHIHCEKLRDVKSEVLCNVICDFYHPLGVQTDFTTQINFLPELLRSYFIEQDKEVEKEMRKLSSEKQTEKDRSKKTDQRQYICKQWKVDPKILFIDKVKWDPPVIDEILRKLQIFDHRNTIPKVIQRYVMDHCDILASKALFLIVKAAKEASVKSDPASSHL
ncbi:Bridge-like lipid transfer protein family member [Dirofilaria immitis]